MSFHAVCSPVMAIKTSSDGVRTVRTQEGLSRPAHRNRRQIVVVRSLIAAGSEHKIVIFVENLIKPNKMKPKSIYKGICGLFASLAFVACNETDIEGAWIEPVPGMENTMQGIDLKKGGEASSINMATLQYETWVKDGDRLILSGRSIGNGTTIPFTDTLVIEKLTDDELSLKKGELVIRYKKQE